MPGLFCRIQWCLCRNVCRTGAQRPECVAVTHCRSRPCADTALQSSWEGEWDQLGRGMGSASGWAGQGCVATKGMSSCLWQFCHPLCHSSVRPGRGASQLRWALSREPQIPFQHKNILFHQSNSQLGSGWALPACRTNQAKPMQTPASAAFPAAFF